MNEDSEQMIGSLVEEVLDENPAIQRIDLIEEVSKFFGEPARRRWYRRVRSRVNQYVCRRGYVSGEWETAVIRRRNRYRR